VEAITGRKAVIPAGPGETERAKRIDLYHFNLLKMRRDNRHDGCKRVH
jgi:hypothetical protein